MARVNLSRLMAMLSESFDGLSDLTRAFRCESLSKGGNTVYWSSADHKRHQMQLEWEPRTRPGHEGRFAMVRFEVTPTNTMEIDVFQEGNNGPWVAERAAIKRYTAEGVSISTITGAFADLLKSFEIDVFVE